MFAKLPERTKHYLVLVAAALALFMNNLGGPTLWDLDEGRNATAALEMMESGNFVVPTFNAQLRVDKPVLLYWLQIAAYELFGINEFAARLPSALAALATVLLCYELGRALFCPTTALLGGLIFGSSAMVLGAGRFANPDALLNAFVACTLTLFWRGHTRPCASWFVGMGSALGLAALTKGPVGIVLPAMVLATYLAWEKRLGVLWDRRIWLGILALALVALPWYVCVTIMTRGNFLRGFLWDHNLRRFLQPLDQHSGSPFYYLLVLPIGMMPWSIFLIFPSWYAIWSMVRSPWPRADKWWRAASETATRRSEDPVAAYRFLGVWLACCLAFFSVSATKLPNYLLPVAMPCALLIARFLDRWRLGEIQPRSWVIPTCLASMGGTGIAFSFGLTLVSGRIRLAPYRGPIIPGLEVWGLFGLVLVAAAAAGWWCWCRRWLHGVVLSFVLGNFLFLAPLAAWGVPVWNQIKAPQPLVEQAQVLLRQEDIRVGVYKLEHLSSLNFYSQREVAYHANEADALAFLDYEVPVYLFLPAPRWEELKSSAAATVRLVARHPDLYGSSDIVVVTNRVPAAEDRKVPGILH